MSSRTDKVIEDQFAELISKYASLKLFNNDGGQWTVEGLLSFMATYNSITIEDDYEIIMILPEDYPEAPPIVHETGGRIPGDFHKNGDKSLCLGAPLKIRMVFVEHPTLLGFVDNLLVGYFYSHSYYEKYGSMPFGELSHGGKGIIDHYKELFEISEEFSIMEFLWILVNGYRGHYECPCHSGKRLRNCHGETLLKVEKYQPKKEFLYDLYQVLKFMSESDNKKLPQKYKTIFSKTKLNQIINNRKS